MARVPADSPRSSPLARVPTSKTTIGEYTTNDLAVIALHTYDEFEYVWYHNTGKRGCSTAYRCISHVKCNRFLRIRREDQKHVLEKSGEHSARRSDRRRKGIHPAFKAEVDAAAIGSGPTKILVAMKLKYAGQTTLLDALPTREQIKNRKAHLEKKKTEKFVIVSHADIVEWSSLRMCETAEVFYLEGLFNRATDETTFATLAPGFRNGTLVTRCFRHTSIIDGKEIICFGHVMTSRQMMRSVLYSYQGQERDGVFAAADGTYKLHQDGWVLVAMGSYRTRFTEARVYSKSFVPWAYMFVRTEHQSAYEEFFRTVKKSAHAFFGIDLQVKFGSLDHAGCIANAYRAVWPDITLLDCYPHVVRKCRERISELNDHDYYENNIAINIKQMHTARSPAQFKAILKLCCEKWNADGEARYTEWFKAIYLKDKWEKWYTTSAAPGVMPSQNALESHNGVIKECGIQSLRANTGVVLNDSIPRIFELAALNAPRGPFGHFCEGPLLSAMIHKAAHHIIKTAHYVKYQLIGHRRVPSSLFFNASRYMDSPTRMHEEVTRARVQRYLDSKRGTLCRDTTVNDIPFLYQSLHEIELIGT